MTGVKELLTIADRPESDGPPGITTRSAALKDGLGVYKTALDMVETMMSSGKDKDKNCGVNVVLNTMVKILKDLIQKVNTQGGMIHEIFDDMNKQPAEESHKEELEKVKADCKNEMEAEIRERVEKLENDFKKRHDELEAEFDRKQKELEKEVDEGRQREMKGTLIISSPERGNMGTLAAHQPIHDYQGNTVRMETDMDLVLRMVAIKTGVRIPISDVVACHRIGKNKKSHSFVLKIGNRQPFSSWDMLNNAMMSGNMSKDNIFINFMLTKTRTEVSKKIRQMKKDKKFQNYAIDQNGKFFVKKNGYDDRYYPVSSIEDIEKLIENN